MRILTLALVAITLPTLAFASPDLSVEASVTDLQTGGLPQYSVTVTVENLGDDSRTGAYVDLFDNEDDAYDEGRYSPIYAWAPPLDAGESHTITFVVEDDGPWWATVDKDGFTGDVHEDNNVAGTDGVGDRPCSWSLWYPPSCDGWWCAPQWICR